MRILSAVVVFLAACSTTALAENTSGPWGVSVSHGPQAAAIDRGPLSGQASIASRHIRPTVIRNQHYWCVPYARAVSGISLRGNAWTWWQGAKGIYQRGTQPEIGAVIVLKRVRSMRLGHVATVSAVIDERTVQVDHANWVRGEIHRGALIRDVSKANDWSSVRVWYPPRNDFGTTNYPVYGFVYPRSSG